MDDVMIYQRATRSFGLDVAARGHHVVYRANESNRCPGCGRAHWYIGRITAECGFCGTAVALAEAQWGGAGGRTKPRQASRPVTDEEAAWAERRRHERIVSDGRTIQLLIDGSPHSFAIQNLSAGGVMGEDPIGLTRGSFVHVRFEGGILVPAEVRWIDGALTGLAFTSNVSIETNRSG